jgi:hypothetical protein
MPKTAELEVQGPGVSSPRIKVLLLFFVEPLNNRMYEWLDGADKRMALSEKEAEAFDAVVEKMKERNMTFHAWT